MGCLFGSNTIGNHSGWQFAQEGAT